MSTEEDRIRLVMEYVGGAGADALRAKQAELKDETAQLVASFTKGETSQKVFDAASKQLASELASIERALKLSESATRAVVDSDKLASKATYDLADAYDLVDDKLDEVIPELKQAETATKNLTTANNAAATGLAKVGTAAGQAQSKVANLGQAGLQTGRVVQDFAQGGIGGVLNNIEGFAMAVGGGPGLAGALTVLGVAAFVAKPFLVSAGESIGLFGDQADKSKTQIENLEVKIKHLEGLHPKLGFDLLALDEAELRLKQLKEGVTAFEEFGKLKDQDQRESGKSIKDALEKAPGGAEGVRAGLTKVKTEEMVAVDPEMQKLQRKIAAEQKRFAEATFEGTKAEAAANTTMLANMAGARRRLLRKEAESQVGIEFKGATEGDVNAQAALAKGLDRSGQRDLAETVRVLSPQGIKGDREAEAEEKRQEERDELDAKLRKARAAQKARDKAHDATVEETNRKVQEAQAKADAKPVLAAAKQADKDEEHAETEEIRDEKQDQARVKKKVNEAASDLKKGTFDERAGVEAAKLRGSGLAPEEQESRLQQMIQAELKRLRPDLNPQERGGIARKLSGEAFKETDRSVGEMTAQGLNTAAATQQTLLNAQASLFNELQKIGADLQQLNNRANQQARHMQSGASRARTAQTNIVPY